MSPKTAGALLNGFSPPAEADLQMTGYDRLWAAVWRRRWPFWLSVVDCLWHPQPTTDYRQLANGGGEL